MPWGAGKTWAGALAAERLAPRSPPKTCALSTPSNHANQGNEPTPTWADGNRQNARDAPHARAEGPDPRKKRDKTRNQGGSSSNSTRTHEMAELQTEPPGRFGVEGRHGLLGGGALRYGHERRRPTDDLDFRIESPRIITPYLEEALKRIPEWSWREPTDEEWARGSEEITARPPPGARV